VADRLTIAAGWVVPVDRPPVQEGVVEIEDGSIRAIRRDEGEDADLRFPDGIALPGLVNAHTHLEYHAMGGLGDGLDFDGWIADHIRRRRALTLEDYAAQSRAGVAACLAAGVTTIADCCYAGTVGEAAADAGLRAVCLLEFFSNHDPFGLPLEDRLAALPDDPLVIPGISPHAPYTVTVEDYALLVRRARADGMPAATHLLESELDTAPLDDLRHVLGADTVAIHVVNASPDDIELLAELDVPVAHCPRSNALLGCGIAPLRELLDAGVRVGLGTDSPASALTFDPWDEMRTAIVLARARNRRADALSAREVLELATIGAARALRLDDRIGTLGIGKSADVTVLDLARSPFMPCDDPYAAAVYGGSPERVAVTIVAGAIRYRADVFRADGSAARAVAAREKMIAS
jgi:5-methylthioadenosine/S-adenosylhomocysteine deaminase